MTVHRRGEGNADNPRQLRKLLLDSVLNILAKSTPYVTPVGWGTVLLCGYLSPDAWLHPAASGVTGQIRRDFL